MERRSIVAVVLGVVSVACATGVIESDSSQPELVVEPLAGTDARGLVNGIVWDRKKGGGLAGALVLVQCTCLPRMLERMTGEGGAFHFGELPPGRYTVQVLYRDANIQRTFDLAAGTRIRADVRVDPERRFIIS